MSPSIPKASSRPRRESPGRAPSAANGSKVAQALAHELHVHQVELEQQNEELRRTQGDLAAARDRFADLYDFAPVGYLTLDDAGLVLEANLTAAAQFGVERAALLKRSFARLVAPQDVDRWQRLQALALRRSGTQCIELQLRGEGAQTLQCQLDCVRVQRRGGRAQLRVTLTDISLRKLAETNRRIANQAYDARESERRRVAYALHEDLGQRLSALKLQLGRLSGAADPEAAAPLVQDMTASIDQALSLVRRMSSELHPLMLDNLGLQAALDWLVRDTVARLGLQITLQVDEEASCLQGTRTVAVYRLAEMALAHLAHRAAGRLRIEVLQRPGDLVLQLQGEAARVLQGACAGAAGELLDAIRDQVHLMGGRLELEGPSEPAPRLMICLPPVA